MSKRVAVVTGSNKGIGYAIVRALCKKFDGDVFLTARDEKLGNAAVQELEKEGISPKFHQLDICDHTSIVKLGDFLQETYKGLDVLVNNAGIAYKTNSTASFGEQAEVTNKTNYFANQDVCNVLFPLLRPHARVVNVSSGAAKFALDKCSDAIRGKLTDQNITMAELDSLINQFIQAAKENKHTEMGFGDFAYGISKAGVTLMTAIQQREMDKLGKEDIVINACTPGYVGTDMTSFKGPLTIDEGAETPVFCALLPPGIDIPRGKFLRDKKVSDS